MEIFNNLLNVTPFLPIKKRVPQLSSVWTKIVSKCWRKIDEGGKHSGVSSSVTPAGWKQNDDRHPFVLRERERERETERDRERQREKDNVTDRVGDKSTKL